MQRSLRVSSVTVALLPVPLHRRQQAHVGFHRLESGGLLVTTRGGDFDLRLGTDVAIGYLSHDAENVQLYLQETLTFLVYTAEASVALDS